LLKEKLLERIDEKRIITDQTLRFAYGTDASFYRLVPEIVLQLKNIDEIVFALKQCYEFATPVTFRAAGTSLSGQAISDSVLIMLTTDWNKHKVIHQDSRCLAEQIWLQPGVIGANANKYLAPFKRKIGPDPASINSCKIGGIAANNASGMCCGIAENSYKTVAGMTIVLFDGTILNTLDPQSVASFKESHHDLLTALCALANECKANAELSAKIRHKYRLKNTMGYALNSLIDFDDVIDILLHLLIGSEGTLAFIADITYNTVVDHPFKSTALYLFADIEQTCKTVSELAKTNVATVELMDNRALRSIADREGMPAFLGELVKNKDTQSAALLIEIHAKNAALLAIEIKELTRIIDLFEAKDAVAFTSDKKVYAQLWDVRKSLYPAVSAVRATATTVIIEDVAFPIAKLSLALQDLDALLKKYRYDEAIIFGHALDGNLHFVFTQTFASQIEMIRYRDFMDDVAQLVAITHQGSLKAEHGTGRNMAPYIELEWGADGYQLMQRIKTIFDPQGILNPGVIINEDKQSHIKNLKLMPVTDDLIDKCMECGFCEDVCPSRNLSLTPRQRNSVYREICRLRETKENPAKSTEMEKAFQYLGIDTCAATGLCADRCPVDINTGDLVRKLRATDNKIANKVAMWTADHFAMVTKLSELGLSGANVMHRVIGTSNMEKMTGFAYKASGHRIPRWSRYIPQPARNLNILKAHGINHENHEKVVYFPSCAVRIMGSAVDAMDQRSLFDVTQSVLKKAGIEVIIPHDVNEQCCGMPYLSKGFNNIANKKTKQLETVLWEASEQGKYPILMDTSPCASISMDLMRSELSIYEPFSYIAEFILAKLTITPQKEPVMLHITCTSQRKGKADVMCAVAKACAEQVIIPDDISCCGFAGDRGFKFPELNRSALAGLQEQVPRYCSEGYSNSITCEIGLSEHSGIEYKSILYLLDKVSC
jgi:D-lactate dehydrogenase